jgi:hypothetical protein
LIPAIEVRSWHKADIRGTATFCPLLDKSGVRRETGKE